MDNASFIFKPVLAGLELYSSGWLGTQRDPPASASWVLELKVCATRPDKALFYMLS